MDTLVDSFWLRLGGHPIRSEDEQAHFSAFTNALEASVSSRGGTLSALRGCLASGDTGTRLLCRLLCIDYQCYIAAITAQVRLGRRAENTGKVCCRGVPLLYEPLG